MDEITALELNNNPAYRCTAVEFGLRRVSDEENTVALYVTGHTAIRGAGYTTPLDVFRVSDQDLRNLAETVLTALDS